MITNVMKMDLSQNGKRKLTVQRKGERKMSSVDKKQPNIVFVLTDDQGYWALGCNGNKEIITPNIDKLAQEGARFENFFCVSPVCSPARASLLTGRIPSQHGIHDWIRKGSMGDDAIEYLQGMRGFTDDLADRGYQCALSGKWHLGDSIKPQKGFTRWYAHQEGGGNYYNAPMIRDGKPIHEEEYLTYAITDQAITYIDEMANEEKPFFISVNYTAPHSPWAHGNHPEELTGLYSDCAFETCPSNLPLHPWAVFSTAPDAVRREDVDNVRPHLEGYYGAITGVDRGIGDIRAFLEEKGISDNTIIIFSSDNGFNCGHHGIWGKGNGTFPFNMYDTSVKVPFIIWHPSRIEPKEVMQLVSGYDFLPTLLEYLDIENTYGDTLPGKSFSHLLTTGEESDMGEEVVVFDEYGASRMIRTYKDKYICRYPYGEDEYFDLINDPEEMVNLVNDKNHEERVVELRTHMEEWFMRYTDPTMDGRLERVSGNGQIDRAGMKKTKARNYEFGNYPFSIKA